MLTLIVLLIIIMMLFFGLYRANSFIRFVNLFLLIVSANIIAGIMYISKFSYSQLYVSNIDYIFFTFIRNIKMPLSTVVRFFNATFFSYMVVSVFLVRFISKIRWALFAFLLIPCFFLLFYTDPTVSQKLFIELNEPMNILIKQNTITIIDYLCIVMLISYMILPIILILFKIKNSLIFTKRIDLCILGISILIINLFMIFGLIMGVFNSIMFYNVTLSKLPKVYDNNVNMIYIVVAIWFIILMMVIVILFFRPFWNTEKSNRKTIGYWNVRQNKELGMILHMYKNAFLSIQQQFALSKINIESNQTAKALANIDAGKSIAQQYMDILNKTLTIIGHVNVKNVAVNLKQCISNAINQAAIPNDSQIKIDIDEVDENLIIFGEKNHITEVFLNLILNSVEALKKRNVDRTIKIVTIEQDGLVQINVNDNGVGIEKKNLRKIFQPFYSSKSGVTGGVGLSYVANIIKQHHGTIRAKSILGEFTEFQIVLPLYKVRSILWKKSK